MCVPKEEEIKGPGTDPETEAAPTDQVDTVPIHIIVAVHALHPHEQEVSEMIGGIMNRLGTEVVMEPQIRDLLFHTMERFLVQLLIDCYELTDETGDVNQAPHE